MNQKILVIGLILAVVLVVGYTQIPEIRKNNSSESENEISLLENYSTQPFMECVECIDRKTWNNKPCCTADFEKDCLAKNGVVRWSDLHPTFTVLRGCFQKAPDTGKECASGNDCMSGVCDLESAINSNKCNLIKKELTGEKNQYGNPEFYTATYSCSTTKPGECTETIENLINPEGVLHYFKMEGNTLIEVQESGPIW